MPPSAVAAMFIRVRDVARPHAARREAAHQSRTEIEIVDDQRQCAAADPRDLAALQVDEADEIVGDRVVMLAVDGLAHELRLAAEAGDVLTEVGVDSPLVGSLRLSSEL